MLLVVGRQLAHPLPFSMEKSGLPLECGVDFKKLIINGGSELVEFHLYNAETSIDRGKKRTLLRLGIEQHRQAAVCYIYRHGINPA